MTLIVPIVGSHFHPPAKWVIPALPNGSRLRLEADPGNPYDAKAIKVWAQPADIPEAEFAELESAIAGAGLELAEVIQAEWIDLGHIGDSDGKLCTKNDWRGNREVAAVAQRRHLGIGELEARLGSLASGQPAAVIEEG